MASSIKYPDDRARWFIEGDKLCLITNVDSDGNTRTTERKQWKAISEAVTNGLLLHYYAEPNSVLSINDELDLDNTMHLAIVDYVKKCLYMDKAGQSTDPNLTASAMQLSGMHQRNFDDSIKRYGMRKRDKTGGSRVLKSVSLM
jgi:hypothetical protein|tara:strand:+ start:1567 stop:1998 length:432 start_codon:yes stop_codon:yes gene_type:complete